MPDNRNIFTDVTCDGLIGILLRASAVDVSHQPTWAIEQLNAVAGGDPGFSQWLASRGLLDRFSVVELCRQLIGDSTWRSTEEDWNRTDGGLSSPSRRLYDCAHTVLRLAGMTHSFAGELDAWQQRILYNFAYGLSHELNNPLANIVTRAGVMAHRNTDPQQMHLLQTIIESAHRGREMLGDLMLLARPPALSIARISMGDLVRDMIVKIRPWCEARAVAIELMEMDESRGGTVTIDASATREALWTLVRNALEAMSHGGRLSICSYFNDNVTDTARGSHAAVEGRARDPADRDGARHWGVIEISDTGPGLSNVSLKNCFDPFYSGREAGRGLGLGLAKAKSLVHRQGGFLELENLPTFGCRASMWLPTQPGAAEACNL
jgi:signal transduction histidine kinase